MISLLNQIINQLCMFSIIRSCLMYSQYIRNRNCWWRIVAGDPLDDVFIHTKIMTASWVLKLWRGSVASHYHYIHLLFCFGCALDDKISIFPRVTLICKTDDLTFQTNMQRNNRMSYIRFSFDIVTTSGFVISRLIFDSQKQIYFGLSSRTCASYQFI